MGLITRARLSVHGFQLGLERGVEQDVTIQAQKTEERSHALQSLHDELLLLR
jgi:hypothetical protein